MIRIKKSDLFDNVVYFIFTIMVLVDFFINFQISKSLSVQFTFLTIGLLSIYQYVVDKRFISTNKLINIFMFLFMYYTPIKQYYIGKTFYSLPSNSDSDYLFANLIIIVFYTTYMFANNKLFKKSKFINIKKSQDLSMSTKVLFVLLVVNIISILWLSSVGELFSFSESDIIGDNYTNVLLRVIRFFPAASVMLMTYTYQLKTLIYKTFINKIFIFLIITTFLIVFFPINGVMSRYLLFSSYICVLAGMFGNIKYKSIILVLFVFGFYFIFPAFNFFKYYDITQIDQFVLGGFEFTSNDYDAHYIFLSAIKYVEQNNFLFCGNILTAIACIIPRSILFIKLDPSGQMIAEGLNATFTNISCPLFAEFYLAGGILFVVIGTLLFVYFIKWIEYLNTKGNLLFTGIYYIIMGMTIMLMRGALLPASSMIVSMILAYVVAYFLVKYSNNVRF